MDNIDHETGVGQHRDVAAVDSVGGCTHTLRQEAFQLRLNLIGRGKQGKTEENRDEEDSQNQRLRFRSFSPLRPQ
jgi:hypothetical protein